MDGGGTRGAGPGEDRAPSAAAVLLVDPSDDIAFLRWFAAMDRAARSGRESPLVWERDDLRAHLLGDEDVDHLVVAAVLDGEVVGTGSLDVPLRDNLDSAALDVGVLPDRRREGVGTTLLTFLVAEATARGRTRLEGEAVHVGTGPREASPGVGFALHHGFRVAHTEDHLVLDAGSAGRGSTPVPDGYTVVGWQDRAPDEHVEAYAEMRSAMGADVPRGQLAREPEVWDVERLRSAERRAATQGRTTLVAAARSAGGRIVAHTTLTVPRGGGREVYQGDTYVATAHRGHGLGRVLKERNLARLAALRGGRPTVVHTWTAETNAAMNAVNRAVGFRVVETTCELERIG